MSNAEPILRVSDLSVVLEGDTIFNHLNFDLYENETLVILGPNGAGKSVLLKALLSILPFRGEISWRQGAKLSYVPQRVPLNRDIPMTVSDFFELKYIPWETAAPMLQRVGIANEAFRTQQLGTLSTGQFQRVLIAWAMVAEPDVILMDEPMAGVDMSGEDIIHSFLHNTQSRKRNLATVLVTHDLSMVYSEATRVLCLNRDKFFVGSPMEILDPKRLQDIYGREVSFIRHDHA